MRLGTTSMAPGNPGVPTTESWLTWLSTNLPWGLVVEVEFLTASGGQVPLALETGSAAPA